MTSDPGKPLLKLDPPSSADRKLGTGRGTVARMFSAQSQRNRIGPAYKRLADSLAKDPSGLSLRTDPSALAPDRLIVFELTGSIGNFVAAARKAGFEFVSEDELPEDETDKSPHLYLLFPNVAALKQMLSLWERWSTREDYKFPRGLTGWRDVFLQLKAIRPWGPTDRVDSQTVSALENTIFGLPDQALVKIECELVHHRSTRRRTVAAEAFERAVVTVGGSVVSNASHAEFSYVGYLVELPVSEIRKIIEQREDSIAGLEPIISILPQCTAQSIGKSEYSEAVELSSEQSSGTPIVAILDAVPVQNHPYLAGRLTIDDPNDLSASAVGQRRHGTAISSVVIHGDLNNPNRKTVNRPVYFRPVMFAPNGDEPEVFDDRRLVIDTIVEAIRTMIKDQENGGEVLVVNISLGDQNRRFSGRASAWARALDYLAYEHSLLFVVSSGNIIDPLTISNVSSSDAFKRLVDFEREKSVFSALNKVKSDRRLLAPAESLNALTVGAWHHDFVGSVFTEFYLRPYINTTMPNVSSAHGNGINRSVKPDILMPGGRERLREKPTVSPMEVSPHTIATQHWGVRVAGPPTPAKTAQEGFTIGTSAAAAFATHTAHRIHDELEAAYGGVFLDLPKDEKAMILKALLASTASWRNASKFIEQLLSKDELENWQHTRRAISQFLGFGFVDPDDAIACAANRATLWGSGKLSGEEAFSFSVPIPSEFGSLPSERSISVSLAWLSPIRAGYKYYRSCSLRVPSLEDSSKSGSGLETSVGPSHSQSGAGTLYHQTWTGAEIPKSLSSSIEVIVQRDKDKGTPIDEKIPFGFAVQVRMPDATKVYDEIRAQVEIKPKIPTPVAI